MSIYDYVYLNQEKIDALYASAVGRSEEQYRITVANKVSGKGGFKFTLGLLIQWLGISPEVSGELAGERATSTEVIQKLLPAQKLHIVRTALVKQGLLKSLNLADQEELIRLVDRAGEVYVVAQSSYKLELTQKGKGDLRQNDQTFMIFGQLGDFKIQMLTSTRSLISSTLFDRFLLLSKGPRGIPLEVIGTLVRLDEETFTIDLDPIAIYYKGKAALV